MKDIISYKINTLIKLQKNISNFIKTNNKNFLQNLERLKKSKNVKILKTILESK